jgi:hypothetical protein
MAMAFPDDADLGVRAEINAGTWVDITSDLRTDQPVTITRGRSDWSQQVSPTKVAAKIRNPVGDYSPRNPTGRYYGQLGRNTALRTSVAAGSPWLGLQPPGVDVRASTPSTSDLNITGDLDLRFDVAPFDYNSLAGVVELGGKWGAAGQRSWECYLFAGTIRFGWTIDGTTEILAVAPLNDTELRPPWPWPTCPRVCSLRSSATGSTARSSRRPTSPCCSPARWPSRTPSAGPGP